MLWSRPGHVLVLHHFDSLWSPGQAEPPKHERYRSDLPLPQLFVQLDQDPQFDQVTSAEIGNTSKYATLVLDEGHLDNCWCCKVFLLSWLLSSQRCQCMFVACWISLHHSSWCNCSKIPSLTIWPHLQTGEKTHQRMNLTWTRVAVAKSCLNAISRAGWPTSAWALPFWSTFTTAFCAAAPRSPSWPCEWS